MLNCLQGIDHWTVNLDLQFPQTWNLFLWQLFSLCQLFSFVLPNVNTISKPNMSIAVVFSHRSVFHSDPVLVEAVAIINWGEGSLLKYPLPPCPQKLWEIGRAYSVMIRGDFSPCPPEETHHTGDWANDAPVFKALHSCVVKTEGFCFPFTSCAVKTWNDVSIQSNSFYFYTFT